MAISDRGFASMSKERRVEIARMGGKASRGRRTKKDIQEEAPKPDQEQKADA